MLPRQREGAGLANAVAPSTTLGATRRDRQPQALRLARVHLAALSHASRAAPLCSRPFLSQTAEYCPPCDNGIEICRAFRNTGRCRNGDECPRIHSEGPKIEPPPRGVCHNWRDDGECKYGESCRFLHGVGDVRFGEDSAFAKKKKRKPRKPRGPRPAEGQADAAPAPPAALA